MPQPWPTRAAAEAWRAAADDRIRASVISAMARVLDEMRAAIIPPTGPPLATWDATSQSWTQWLVTDLADLIRELIDSITSLLRSPTVTDYAAEVIANAQSRLRAWPAEAWTEVRATIEESIFRGDSTSATRERVGDALDITALTRTTEAQIEALYDRIARGVPRDQETALRARIRDLSQTRDVDRRRWEWRADRIARTEVTMAMSAGVDGYAIESATATGTRWVRQWISSRDGRVRDTHRLADGQTSPIGGTFLVGGVSMRRPGDPLAPAHEVINCRCGLLLLEP